MIASFGNHGRRQGTKAEQGEQRQHGRNETNHDTIFCAKKKEIGCEHFELSNKISDISYRFIFRLDKATNSLNTHKETRFFLPNGNPSLFGMV